MEKLKIGLVQDQYIYHMVPRLTSLIVYGKIIVQPIQKAVEQLLLEMVRRPHLQIVSLIQIPLSRLMGMILIVDMVVLYEFNGQILQRS